MKALIVGGMCFIIPLLSLGQWSGRVLDAHSKQPIVGALVIDYSNQVGLSTDSLGRFAFAILPTVVEVRALSYKTDTIQVLVGQSQVEIFLEQDYLNEVKVVDVGQATELSMLNPQGFQTLGIKELCKAACCNLSESFETNASIDAAFTDAITGTKQIRMLGLEGKYTQIMFDNMPAVRGLASTYGLTYVPGSFIHQIQIAKGAGSVTSGFESIAGQINVAYKSPDNAEKFFINAYYGSGGRSELNVIWNPTKDKLHRKWTTSVLAHGAYSQLRWDMNGDGFLDNPLFTNAILRNEWHWNSKKGWGGQYAVTGIYLSNLSGQTSFEPKESLRAALWGAQMATHRAEASAKTGYVFPNQEWKSFGFQANAVWHQQSGQYGWRNYEGAQQYMRLNALFATRIKDDRQKVVVGLSAIIDDYDERVFFDRFPPIAWQSLGLQRNELTMGGFVEHTWTPNPDFVAVTGARIDHHNTFGWMPTPRAHLRWSLNERTSIKAMFGIGRRMPNAFMDNVGLFASNRDIRLPDASDIFAGGLAMEKASNMGFIFARKGKLWHRAASMAIDVYYTQFYNQAVVDFEVPEVVSFYNLNGQSFSKSAQCEIQYSPARRLDVRMAYRWLEVKTQYASGFLDKPLVNKHRAFVNLAYETKATKKDALWRMDATLQWISQKRIPTSAHSHGDQPMTWSPGFEQLSAQVTWVFSKSLEIYLGGENLTNFMVHNPIFSAENPQDKAFDSSLIWGPVFGRMVYVGLRWNLL